MPQRGDKDQSIYFGRVAAAEVERIKDQPGAIVEKAVPMLEEAIAAGKTIQYRPTLRTGVSRTLWLSPETVEIIDRICAKTGLRRTPVIVAALDEYFGGAPAGQGQAEG